MKVNVEGLTFVTHDAQLTVWAGEPGESEMLGAGQFSPAPSDEAELYGAAVAWLAVNRVAEKVDENDARLREVLGDIASDQGARDGKVEALSGLPAVGELVSRLRATMAASTVAYTRETGQPTEAVGKALVEALTATFEVGFMAGQSFERRGYRL